MRCSINAFNSSDIECTYSIDKAIIKGTIKNEYQYMLHAYLEKCSEKTIPLKVDNNRLYRYKDLYVIKLTNKATVNIFIGLIGVNMNAIKIEYNPNFSFDLVDKLLSIVFSMCENDIYLDKLDLAIDMAVDTECTNFYFKSIGRSQNIYEGTKYSRSRDRKCCDGRTKIYDKAKESKTKGTLTRIEITIENDKKLRIADEKIVSSITRKVIKKFPKIGISLLTDIDIANMSESDRLFYNKYKNIIDIAKRNKSPREMLKNQMYVDKQKKLSNYSINRILKIINIAYIVIDEEVVENLMQMYFDSYSLLLLPFEEAIKKYELYDIEVLESDYKDKLMENRANNQLNSISKETDPIVLQKIIMVCNEKLTVINDYQFDAYNIGLSSYTKQNIGTKSDGIKRISDNRNYISKLPVTKT